MSKNRVNSSGDVPSPCFTPKFVRNSNHVPDILSKLIPFDPTYMFLIIYTRSAGRFRQFTKTSHNFSRLILSYARSKSTKQKPIYLFVRMLCCSRVCKIRAYSMVLWRSLKPAYVGACKFSVFAWSVKRLFITAINSLAKGGATAMLR